MAVGSQSHSHSKGNGSRGRPYALMLLLAFGAALLGVMLLHKFRERRICNLLLKQTDQDLLSLQFLFQKQRDLNKELEKSNEDMKATVYSLRNQKMELDRRLLEMQSTIDSLRDEQKAIDVALQENQNEIKMLREREVESGKENSLSESLKHKEAELEDLRHQLQARVKVRSVATDDPSNPHVHSSKERHEQLLESGRYKGENESMTRVDIGTEKSAEKTEKREMMGKQREKQESSEDENEDEEEDVNGKESEITQDHKEEEVKDSQKPDGVPKSGMKKKVTETGKYGHTNKIKGKRWRYIARKRRLDDQRRLISKNRNSDGSGVKSMRHREFFESEASKEEKMKKEYRMEATNSMDSAITDWLKHQPKKIEEDDREGQMEKEGKMLKQPSEFNSTEGDGSSEDEEQRQEEDQSENEDVEGNIERNPGEKVEPEDFKTNEKQEQGAEDQVTGESSSDVKEEYKEETDESEY